MPMIAYGQNLEDVLLSRLFPAEHAGFYVDIGANHPVHCSVTKHFYDCGWTGVNVEPSGIFDLLRKERPRDVNLNAAVSSRNGTAVLYEYPSQTTDSTLETDVAKVNEQDGAACRQREVQSMTLARLCEQHVGDRTIDFMSIDVEGHELAVIASGDWNRFRPRVVMVESTLPHARELTDLAWEPVLLEHRYQFGLFDGLNRYYVREEDPALLPLLRTPIRHFEEYVTYASVLQGRQLQELAARLRGAPQDMSPGAYRAGMRIARLLQATARRMPWLTATARPIMRRLI
jgi:FkbM family methyltransferase